MAKGQNQTYIPYGRQCIDDDDIDAVVQVLRSDWLTTGPVVAEFEQAVASFTGATFGVAIASGTAALHAVMHAIDINPKDEVIVPAITFVATANAVIYQGGTPVFADIQEDTMLLDPVDVLNKITSKTKAIVAVDYAGQPCDYDALRKIASDHDLFLIADSCHAIGAEYKKRKVGTLADFTVFSFHPVKHITTGEGGMIVTGDKEFAEKIRRFRNHGINLDHRQRESQVAFHYDMETLGYNLRISDIQCALGLSQLKKLPAWLERRRGIAHLYNSLLGDVHNVEPLHCVDVSHGYHLYVVKLGDNVNRDLVFRYMRDKQVGVNVHYQPVYQHSYYQQNGFSRCQCVQAEEVYQKILSLPMYIGLTDSQVKDVVRELSNAIDGGC